MTTNTACRSASGEQRPRYHLLREAGHRPPFDRCHPADYVVAGDGVLMRVPYLGMVMDVPVVSCTIRGLAPWSTFYSDDPDLAFEQGFASDGEFPEQPFAPRYHLVDGGTVPPLETGRIYDYLVAANGVFLRAERRGVGVVMPISPPCDLVGLAPLEPTLDWPYPRIGAQIVERMLERARAQTVDGAHYEECLFYLHLNPQGDAWLLVEPEQERTGVRVVPRDTSLASARGWWCEAHSHHTMPAYFSETDDRDEQWFGVYAVLGRITTHPELRVRIVVDGYRWPIPASWIYDLPPGVSDAGSAGSQEERGGQW